jgi:hypothetical protein
MLGYGEDSLSLHALSTGLAAILGQLGDDSDPARALVFFRPSFGRKGAGSAGPPRAEFGEFDAIIGTSTAVYLCEAKWRCRRRNLVLKDEQLRRHRVFRAYLEEHRVKPCNDWSEFHARMLPKLQLIRSNLIPAPIDSTMARNLTYVLQQLNECGQKIVDVLMFWKLAEADVAPSTCGNFRVVTHLCVREDNSKFVRIRA